MSSALSDIYIVTQSDCGSLSSLRCPQRIVYSGIMLSCIHVDARHAINEYVAHIKPFLQSTFQTRRGNDSFALSAVASDGDMIAVGRDPDVAIRSGTIVGKPLVTTR